MRLSGSCEKLTVNAVRAFRLLSTAMRARFQKLGSRVNEKCVRVGFNFYLVRAELNVHRETCLVGDAAVRLLREAYSERRSGVSLALDRDARAIPKTRKSG